MDPVGQHRQWMAKIDHLVQAVTQKIICHGAAFKNSQKTPSIEYVFGGSDHRHSPQIACIHAGFRGFAGRTNEKWLTDITEFQIPAGKVYLSPIIDCFDGMVVSWSIGTRPNAELVNAMLDAAIDRIGASYSRPVVHSDRGGHYRWPGWLSRIADTRLIRSMSRKGCSPDNPACEGFFGRLKIEMFYYRDWLHTTIDDFVAYLVAYIRWYNEARIKISLGARSPIEHRRSLGITV